MVQTQIEAKLQQALTPHYLEIINESHQHRGPAEESHFKIICVAEAFADLNAVKRHQTLYTLLSDELENGVHALAMHLYSPNEWDSAEQVPASPQCQGKH